MIKELRNKATLHYNNFLFFKKKTKKIFKNIIIYINIEKINLSDFCKENIKLLINKWNNTDNYNGNDYIEMKTISNNIFNQINDDDLTLKELFKNYLSNFDKFQKDLIYFYEYAEKIKKLEDK